MTGLGLVVVMLASVGAAIIVTTQHLGFAPVLSASMEPDLHPGDLIITKPEPAAEVKVGQIVALPVPSSPGERYTHRVISISDSDGRPVVHTQGDANATPEPFALRIDSPTVPVVVGTVPYVGRLSVLLQRRSVRLSLIAVTIVAILLSAWRLIAGVGLSRARVDVATPAG